MLPLILAFGVATAAHDPAQAAPLHPDVILHLVHRCPPAMRCVPRSIVTRMKAEAERIWSLLDVRIAWIDSIDARPPVHAAGLTVILEEGPYPAWAGRTRGLVLAAVTQPDEPCGWGVARVWFRRVHQYVASVSSEGHPFATLPNSLADALLSRGLGRALAHEIGHYLLGTAEHAAFGLMRPFFAPREVLEESGGPLYGLGARDRAALVACRTEPHETN